MDYEGKTKDTSIEPLYIQLANYLREKIVHQEFEKGMKIPSEMELHNSTGMSRSTVRKAIELLVNESMLTKVHGKGTFVSNDKITENRETHFLSFTENVERMGKKLTTKTVNIQNVIPTLEQRKFFNISESEILLEIVRVRYLDDTTICVETNWFTQEYQQLAEEDLDRSLYAILKEKYGVIPSTGKKSFEICFATQQEAFLLDVPRGSALMLIEDYVYSNEDKPLHIAKQILRGDKFKYAIEQ